jgi:hypothetical protein
MLAGTFAGCANSAAMLTHGSVCESRLDCKDQIAVGLLATMRSGMSPADCEDSTNPMTIAQQYQ